MPRIDQMILNVFRNIAEIAPRSSGHQPEVKDRDSSPSECDHAVEEVDRPEPEEQSQQRGHRVKTTGSVDPQVKAYVDEVWPEVVADIASLVAIESVEDPATAGPGRPWGEGPARALDQALVIAQRMGFTAHNLDGAIGYAEIPGEKADEPLATIAHVDVVPAGEGWDSDPFEMQQRDGYLVGRGVLDDKGPFVLSLWAAEYFRRQGKPLAHPIHVIAGANEETGMGDVETYLEQVGEPWFLFTPDADFPVGHGEKGVFTSKFSTSDIAGSPLLSLTGGTVKNAVPGKAEAVLSVGPESLASLEVDENIQILPGDEPGTTRIVATGIGGHAAMPEGTVNAIGLLVDFLWKNRLYGPRQERFLAFERLLCSSTDGKALDLDYADDRLGALTLNAGVVRTENNRFTQTIDIRYPEATTAEHLHAELFRAAELHGCTMEKPEVQPPYYQEADSPFVEALLGAFCDATGEEAEAYTMGGGTYARHFANGLSFGPERPDPDAPEWVGHIHGPNEAVSEERLKEALAIYIDAISRLEALEL